MSSESETDRRMLSKLWASLAVVSTLAALPALAETPQRTPPYEFVSEYVRELGEGENIRESAQHDLTDTGDVRDRLAGCVRNSEAFQLELGLDVRTLSSMHLSDRYDPFRLGLIAAYQRKIGLWRDLHDSCATLLAGPKPGVDVGAIAAKAPDLNAKLDFEDHGIFDITPAIFLSMVDERPDRSGKLTRLLITADERKRLIDQLNGSFGDKLNEAKQNWTVSVASVLRDALVNTTYKSADDPN